MNWADYYRNSEIENALQQMFDNDDNDNQIQFGMDWGKVEETGGSKQYLALLERMKDLHIRKNAGYSGDNPDPWINFREAEDLGVSAFKGVLIRMSDKWIRIKNLVKDPDNDKVGENVKDTLMDLASYALIAIAVLEEQE